MLMLFFHILTTASRKLLKVPRNDPQNDELRKCERPSKSQRPFAMFNNHEMPGKIANHHQCHYKPQQRSCTMVDWSLWSAHDPENNHWCDWNTQKNPDNVYHNATPFRAHTLVILQNILSVFLNHIMSPLDPRHHFKQLCQSAALSIPAQNPL